MSFFRPAQRRTSSRAPRLAALAAVALGLLAGCGGGTSQVDRFQPERLLVFGDELSVITSDGRKYTTNSVDDNGRFLCKSSPIWVQYLAVQYNMVFAECNPDVVGNPQAKMLAVAGATADGLADQVRTFSTGDSVRPTDLATVLVGMNDVLDAYAAFPAEDEASLVARVQAAGRRVAAQVNGLAAAGARVLVATIPDMGLTPFAAREDVDFGDTRSRLLSRLSVEFNTELRLNLVNDGSKLGLLLPDDLVRSMVRVPGAYGLRDVKTPVCRDSAVLPDCNNQTLIPGEDGVVPNGTSYLWADTYRPTIAMHTVLGQQAVRRALNNPF